MAESTVAVRHLHLHADAGNPAISPITAAALSVSITLLYVLPFYLSAQTRPSPTILRDSPGVIRARIRTVTISTVIIILLTAGTSLQTAHLPLPEVLHLLGLWPIDSRAVIQSLLLVALLFAGPLFEAVIVQEGWRDLLHDPSGLLVTLTSWPGLRNYVAGPLTEELAFRAAVVPLHLLAGFSPSMIVFATPLYFGIAHVHHCYEFCLTHPRTPLLPAVLRSVFQFTYTSVFGAFATFLFLRTASVWACVLAHSFCNCMGLPRLWGRIEGPEPRFVATKSGSVPVTAAPAAEGQTSRPAAPIWSGEVTSPELPLWWTIVYYALLVFGAWGFKEKLWSWTRSELALLKVRV